MDTSKKFILTTSNLRKHVPSLDGSSGQMLHILNGVDLEIKSGETIAILGKSGSGKSTLLGLMAGLDLPSSGDVCLDNTRLNELDEDGRAQIRLSRVGFVFQSFQLLPNLTALENVMLPLELKMVPDAEMPAMELLNRVGLGERLHHYPRQLSGGEQQRVAIARAFVVEPAIVFADEPTGNLDTVTSNQIIKQLFDVNHEKQTTLVMVTHDENLARLCQRRLILKDGVLMESQS